jgi:hypothetical protein
MPADRSLPDIAKSYGRSQWLRLRVRARIAWDPVLPLLRREIVRIQKPVVDIGCGIGLLGITMRASGIPLRYRGTDIAPTKINKAKDSVRYYGFEDIGFDVVDALSTQIPPGATVCMIDSLHRLDPDSQFSMLAKLADAAESGSLILFRTRLAGNARWDPARIVHQLTSTAARILRRNAGHLPSVNAILDCFDERGLHAEIQPLRSRGPYAGHFIRIEPAAPTKNRPSR